MNIEVDVAEATQEATDELFPWLISVLPQVALAPIDPETVYRQIWAGLSADSSVVLNARAAGQIVGSLCIYEAQFAYSKETFLRDKWFAADPAAHGEAGRALMEAAKAIAEHRNKVLILTRMNVMKALARGVIGTTEGYIPLGKVLRIR